MYGFVSIPEILKYGIAGLVVILALLAYRLLKKEQARDVLRKEFLITVYIFMLFSIILVLVCFFEKKDDSSSHIIPERNTGFPIGAFNGYYNVTGNDVDFTIENFTTPRHNYAGEVEMKENGNDITIEGTVRVLSAIKDTIYKSTIFKAVCKIHNNYIAGQYYYGDDIVYGFGTILIEFKNTISEAKGYLLFRPAKGDAKFGVAQFNFARIKP